MASYHRSGVDGVLYPDALYTMAGITKALNIGAHKIAEEIKSGRLKAHEYGRGYMFLGADIIALVTGMTPDQRSKFVSDDIVAVVLKRGKAVRKAS